MSLIYAALSRGIFLYGDDILMYQVTEAMMEQRTVAVRSPFAEGDVAQSIRGKDGRGYAKYGIGLSLVAIPSYVVSDLVAERLLPLKVIDDGYGNRRAGPPIYATSLINAPIGGATASLCFLLALACGFRRRTALVLAIVLAFTTLMVHYSATFLSEPLSALCLIAVVYGLLRAWPPRQLLDDDRRPLADRVPVGWLAFSGFAAGLALATKLANGVALIAPGLWLIWLVWNWLRHLPKRALLACVAWGAPIAGWLALIGLYNRSRFDSITETGYGSEAGYYTAPFTEGLPGLLLSPGKGLFWYNPPLLLALVGFALLARRRPALALVIAGMLIGTLALYSRYYIWWGGGVWGTRFLVPLLPLLILPAGEVIERMFRRGRGAVVARIAVVALALLGLAVTALAVLVPFDRYVGEYQSSPERFDAALWDTGSSPIVVHARRVNDSWGSPDLAAEWYASRRIATLSVLAAIGGIAVLGWTVWATHRSNDFAPHK